MANFRTTTPKFGNVEAYARRHRRSVPVLGKAIQLSLQQSALATTSPSLIRLVDGSSFSLEMLSTVVPSLRGLTWEFRKPAAAIGFELVTIADDIEVILSTPDEPAVTIELEGMMRGIAARLVVALEYGG